MQGSLAINGPVLIGYHGCDRETGDAGAVDSLAAGCAR